MHNNRNYSQWIRREELFERERSSDPDFAAWNSCVLLCDYAHDFYTYQAKPLPGAAKRFRLSQLAKGGLGHQPSSPLTQRLPSKEVQTPRRKRELNNALPGKNDNLSSVTKTEHDCTHSKQPFCVKLR
jgi:hypothetical protein